MGRGGGEEEEEEEEFNLLFFRLADWVLRARCNNHQFILYHICYCY